MTSNRFQWVSFCINFDKFAYIQIAKMRIINCILFSHLFVCIDEVTIFIAQIKSTSLCLHFKI